jgi:hypothetical protein
MPVSRNYHARQAFLKLVTWVTLLLVAPALACNVSSAVGLANATPQSIPAPGLSASATTIPALPTALPPTSPAIAPPTDLPPTPTIASPASPPPGQATGLVGPQIVKVFLVAVGDNGASGKLIGCGDSLVPVTHEIVPTQGVLRAALEILLGIKTQYYGQSGLNNALYQSDLTIDDLRIDNGKASIYLAGRLLLGGVCDNPRVEAQLVEIARQFSTVKEVEIFINGKPLKDVLSEK